MDEEDYVYLDVRSIPEFEQGHPAGAYNIPLLHMSASGAMEPNPDFLRVVNATFDRDQRLVIGCRTGVRSLRAAEMLDAAGWAHVVDQRAGWEGPRDAFGQITEAGWARVGLPTSTEAEPGRRYEELAR